MGHGRVRPCGARVPASLSSASVPGPRPGPRRAARAAPCPRGLVPPCRPGPRPGVPASHAPVGGTRQPRAHQQWGQFSLVHRPVSGAASAVERRSPPHCHRREPPEQRVTAGPANQRRWTDRSPHGATGPKPLGGPGPGASCVTHGGLLRRQGAACPPLSSFALVASAGTLRPTKAVVRGPGGQGHAGLGDGSTHSRALCAPRPAPPGRSLVHPLSASRH